MSSALLAGRVVPSCLAQRHGATRRPAPFTAARTPVAQRRVFARAQESAPAASNVTDAELAELVEEEDFDLDIYAAAAAGDEDDLFDEDDVDMQAALEAAALLSDDVDPLTAAAIAAEMDEEKQEAASALETMLARKLASQAVSAAEIESIAAGIPEAELEEVVLEDQLPPMSSDRYEEVALSANDKEAVARFKLSKGELRNLLPQDWDQINIDFFSNKRDENIPLPEYRLNVLWTDKNLAVAIDQVYSRGQVSPLTEYYFWPRQDAWEELRMNLENRPWISERDRIILLNRLTQLINFWQDEEVKHTVDEARNEFPDCAFAIA